MMPKPCYLSHRLLYVSFDLSAEVDLRGEGFWGELTTGGGSDTPLPKLWYPDRHKDTFNRKKTHSRSKISKNFPQKEKKFQKFANHISNAKVCQIVKQ